MGILASKTEGQKRAATNPAKKIEEVQKIFFLLKKKLKLLLLNIYQFKNKLQHKQIKRHNLHREQQLVSLLQR